METRLRKRLREGDSAGSSAARKATKRSRGSRDDPFELVSEEEKPEVEEEPEEKRGARYISKPSSAVRDRIARPFEHRLFLIDQKRGEDGISCQFIVLGATGNVYRVNLEKRPSCDCPDFGRCHTCKHILFVMLKVLKLPRDDPRVWQEALLASELREMLAMLDTNQVGAAVVASQRVRQQFRKLEGGSNAEEAEQPDEAAGKKPVQRPVEGDCPVCYEAMEPEGEAVVFCDTCGNNVHKDCFAKWSQSKAGTSRTVTCIYCRAVWKDQLKLKLKQPEIMVGGRYVNLASFSEQHQAEDLSMEALYPDMPGFFRRRYGF